MNSTNVSTQFYCYMEPMKTIILYIDCILLVPIIGMNLLTIICCIRYHQLRTYTNTFITSLAASDLLFGLLTLAPGIWLKAQSNYSEKVSCLFVMTAGLGSFLISLSNLMMLSVERYIAVCRPFHYNSWVTHRTSALSVASCWFGNLILILLLFCLNKWTDGAPCNYKIFPTWLQFTILVLALFTFGLTVWCYFHVLIVVRKQFKTVHSVCSTAPIVSQAEIKKAIMMMIMFGLFVAFLLPLPILKVAEIKLRSSTEFIIIKCLLITLVKVNYIINSLVYNICNKLLRKATLHLLCCSRQPLRVPD